MHGRTIIYARMHARTRLSAEAFQSRIGWKPFFEDVSGAPPPLEISTRRSRGGRVNLAGGMRSRGPSGAAQACGKSRVTRAALEYRNATWADFLLFPLQCNRARMYEHDVVDETFFIGPYSKQAR